MRRMTPDLEKLREIVRTNAIVESILETLARSRMRRRITRLVLVHERRAHGRISTPQFQEILTGFRLLASCGFGQLHEVTVRERARFEWTVHPQVVRDAAANPALTLQPSDLLDPTVELAGEVREEAVPAGCRRHAFALRPDVEVTLTVPEDLTAGEARRLGHFLLSLAREP
jgi:hypothetical protein